MFKISFDFNEISKEVSNISVIEYNEEECRLSKDSQMPIFVKVELNKLVLSSGLIKCLNISAGDRVSINYVNIDNATTFPVIGKAIEFGDPDSGNKITKSNTVSYRGNNRNVILQYGSLFTIEKYKQNQFKMISIDSIDQCNTI